LEKGAQKELSLHGRDRRSARPEEVTKGKGNGKGKKTKPPQRALKNGGRGGGGKEWGYLFRTSERKL